MLARTCYIVYFKTPVDVFSFMEKLIQGCKNNNFKILLYQREDSKVVVFCSKVYNISNRDNID